MRRRTAVSLIFAAILLSVVMALFVPRDAGLPLVPRGGSVGVIRVEGVIMSGGSGSSLFGATAGSDDIMALIDQAVTDPQVRAVVLRVNSPGGSAAGSQEIAEGLAALKAAGKPVVVSMGDVAASGGYWIAAGADRIVANAATFTGSIGVIMELQNFEEMYRKLGIDFEVIKSGPLKDMGSDARPLTGQERALLQAMVDDVFDQFVEVVASGRNLDRAAVLELADGRVFTGRQAQAVGLVDDLGSFNLALDTAAELAGLGQDYLVKELARRSTLQRLLAGLEGALGVLGSPARLTIFKHYLSPAR